MRLHDRPIDQRIAALLELARNNAATFSGPTATLARERYLARHPTRILVMKCMDGRLHLPHATRTPPGILTPFRNLGGIFDLGWPYLGELVSEAALEAIRAGNGVLMIITYHFSRGHRERGCAGFACDREAALAHARRLQAQAERLFGAERQHVYPLVCGFETDRDALIVHGDGEACLDLGELEATDATDLAIRVQRLCPDMPADIRRDLLPLLEGNLAHTRSLHGVARELDIEHREWAICVGRGFDFLHLPNTALIIGPYGPDLAEPIVTAAAIIEANMRAGRIPDDGFLLLASTPYQSPGVDRARAELKSHFLADYAGELIRQRLPELGRRMHRRTAVVHWPTRHLDLLDIP